MAGGTLNTGGSAAGPMSPGHAGSDEASELRKRVSDLAGVQTMLSSGQHHQFYTFTNANSSATLALNS